MEDHCGIGGLVAIHQFTRIGCYCFVGGMSGVAQDLPPYTLCEGNRAKPRGLNTIGLKRAGFSEETLTVLKQAYRIIFRNHTPLEKGPGSSARRGASCARGCSFVGVHRVLRAGSGPLKMSQETIGIIAGASQFPLLFARAAKAKGYRVVAVAHKGETFPELEREVDELTW